MYIFVLFYLFILGSTFGSFALAMVDRMHAGRDWVKGRSQCDSCRKKLTPQDLIPVISWLRHRGKCRHCSVKLTAWYPAVEIALGLAFVLSFALWPYDISTGLEIAQFGLWLVSLVIMTGLVIFDVRWFLLPNKLVYPLIGLSGFWAVLDSIDRGVSAGLIIGYGASILVASGIFLALFTVSKGAWIGDGDIRLGVAIGLFTGSAFQSGMVLFFASLIGLGVGLPVMLKSNNTKDRMKLQLPFGPMLIVALCLVVLFGEGISDWYRTEILLL